MVRASAGGKVVEMSGGDCGKYCGVAVKDEAGYTWRYWHLQGDSIPNEIYRAFGENKAIPEGAILGAVVEWLSSSKFEVFNQKYNHIHLTILDKNGLLLNPLIFLKPVFDVSAPEIVDIALVQDGRRLESAEVSADYHIVAEVRDLIHHRKFYEPPYSLHFKVDDGSWRQVWKFDLLPGNSEEVYVRDLFWPSQSRGDYEERRFSINLGFSFEGTQWQGPYQFPRAPGEHRLLLSAGDLAGNYGVKEFRWTVVKPGAR
ncbi:MAG: hypothetical protein HY921_05720 [Elusimicrobia bacterium]|nr:hypothetical protein [Elusimicrobiota bacterium]